jgi:hypothetical protein
MVVPSFRNLTLMLSGTVFAIVATVACSLVGPNYHEWTLNDGAIVLGSNDGFSWMPTEFFSVRIKDSSPGSAMRSTARLHLRGREFELRRLTPADLQALGIDVRPDDLGAGEQRAFVGYGEQNRAGALEFTFTGGRLREFYGRCHDATECDYELSWPARSRFKLPILEERASSVLAPVASVRDFHGQ